MPHRRKPLIDLHWAPWTSGRERANNNYVIIRKANGRVIYNGETTGIEKRRKDHSGCKDGTAIQLEIRICGVDQFAMVIIDGDDHEDSYEAKAREWDYIQFWDTYCPAGDRPDAFNQAVHTPDSWAALPQRLKDIRLANLAKGRATRARLAEEKRANAPKGRKKYKPLSKRAIRHGRKGNPKPIVLNGIPFKSGRDAQAKTGLNRDQIRYWINKGLTEIPWPKEGSPKWKSYAQAWDYISRYDEPGRASCRMLADLLEGADEILYRREVEEAKRMKALDRDLRRAIKDEEKRQDAIVRQATRRDELSLTLSKSHGIGMITVAGKEYPGYAAACRETGWNVKLIKHMIAEGLDEPPPSHSHRIPVFFLGIWWESKAACARACHTRRCTITRWIAEGHDMPPHWIDFDGGTFPGLSALARRYGKSAPAVKKWIDRGLTAPPEDDDLLSGLPIETIFWDMTFPSRAACRRHFGIAETTWNKWMAKGLDRPTDRWIALHAHRPAVAERIESERKARRDPLLMR